MRLRDKMNKLLTIGMATYDDYDGVYFTIQSLRMHHEICDTKDVEYIVLDNNPSSESGKATKKFVQTSLRELGTYLEKTDKQSSFNKYEIVKHANGKYVIILDCHILMIKNAINSLLDYYKENENCKDLVQGPLVYDDLKNVSTHFNPNWSGHMYGTWGTNKEKYDENKPFEIQLQGMGLCSFEKENWPGICPYFKGFGGEEGYISEKFRRNGGKNICLPELGWVHRFGRPLGVKYPLILEDRIWNYFIGWLEITRDPNHQMIKDIYEYFKDKIPPNSIDNIFNNAKNLILGENYATT
jgi:hypothetical protein